MRGLLDGERLAHAQQAQRTRASGSERLAQVLVRERLVAGLELGRLIELLRAGAFGCPRCGHGVSYDRLAGLASLTCRCGEELRFVPAPAVSDPGTRAARRPPAPAAVPEPPCRLGTWQLLAWLGRGSFGVVYRARRDGLERDFALKLLRPEVADEETVARFRVEAAAASRVEDPGIVGVIEVGEAGPYHYYAMEYCPGRTLQRRVHEDGPLPWREVARAGAALARTLAAAHAAGVIHRDLKPANVIVEERSGRPRITDFGLARATDLSRSMTQTGEMVGTPMFASPEQLRGEKARGPAVDVYGLGATLYATLTGRPPHDGASLVELAQRVHQVDPSPPETLVPGIPRGLGAILLRALRRDPRERPTAVELAQELEAFLARTERGERRPARAATGARRPVPAAAVAGGVALLGLVVAIAAVALTPAAGSGPAGASSGKAPGAAAARAAPGSADPADPAGPAAAQQAPAPLPGAIERAPGSGPAPAPGSAPAPASAPAAPPAAAPPDWGLAYYMPYDGPLSGLGRGIVEELARGASSRVRVAVQADFAGPGGSSRWVLRPGVTVDDEQRLPDVEASAELATFVDWLAWVEQVLPAKRLGLVLLGPGARLEDTCYDAHPAPAYQRLPEVAAALARFRARARARGAEVELLFLQQAGRGQGENFHLLRGAARVVMASQTNLGAPNTYYASALARLTEGDLDGAALARAIAEGDAPTMFSAYSALDAAALDELPARLEPVVAPLRALPSLRLDGPALQEWITFDGGDELFLDGLALLRALHRDNGLGSAAVDRFAAWVDERLVVVRRVTPGPDRFGNPRAPDWCGFSLFLPRSADQVGRYQDRYPLVREVLGDVWRRLAPGR